MKDFHERMIREQGTIATVDKTIQEATEFIEALRDYKTLFYADKIVSPEMMICLANIQEESMDLGIMKARISKMFKFSEESSKAIVRKKVQRTIERYLN